MDKKTKHSLIVAGLLGICSGSVLAQHGLGVVFVPEVRGVAEAVPGAVADSIVAHARARLQTAPGLALFEPWANQQALRPTVDRRWGLCAPPAADSLVKASGAAAMVHLRVEVHDSLLEYDCAAIEPASGVAIGTERGELVLSDGYQGSLELVDEAIDRLSARLLSEITPYGYPFPEDQVGLLIVAADSSDFCLSLHKAIDESVAHGGLESLKRKVLWNCLGRDVGEARHAAEVLHASLVLTCVPGAFAGPAAALRAYTPLPSTAEAVRTPLTPLEGSCVEVLLGADEVPDAAELIMARAFHLAGKDSEAIALATAALRRLGTSSGLTPWLRLVCAQARHALARRLGTAVPSETIDLALEDYAACLAASQVADDSLRAPHLLFNVADLHRLRGDQDRAVAGFARAAVGFSRMNAWREQILSYEAIEEYHRSRRAWSHARTIRAGIVTLAQRAGDAQTLGNAYEDLGMLFEVEELADSALDAYRRGLEVYRLVGNIYGTAELEGKLGKVFRRLGQADSARVHFMRQISLGQELHSEPLLAKGHFNLALLLRADNKPDSALAHFQASLEQLRLIDDLPGVARALNNLGAIYHETGDSAQAARYYTASLETARQAEEEVLTIRAMLHLGDLCRDGQNYGEANAWYEKALASARNAGDVHGEALSLFSLGLVRVKTGKISDGYLLLERAVRLGESVEPEEFAPQREFLRRLRQIIGQ
ncbi:MAG: tetratricopeptide repeat protein [candidate division KSB1 bacterium]|nr:tetratricopeptide repeat protein [candidate division KSB1 bacterium]